MKKKIIFIINPVSGMRSQMKKRLPSRIEHLLDQEKFDYSISYSQYEGHAEQIAEEAVENGVDIVVAVGGDGSINEIAGALINTDAVLGIMPFGSGNGLARHLGIPINVKKAIGILNNLNVRKIDAGEYAEGKYFFSNVGIGFAADVAKRFSNHIVRGFFSYAVAVIRESFTFKFTKLKLQVDGKVMEREVAIFNVFNSSQYGYGVGLVPWAEVDDGILNLCIINRFPGWQFIFYAILILLKKQKKIPHIEFFEAASFKVINEQKENWLVQVDGEVVNFDEDWQVKVYPLALNVIAPS